MLHRTLTIMFSDMRGFTSRTSSQSRAATADMIKQHKDLLLPVIIDRGGKLIKTIGDAFLVSFESPTDAVLAGMALQNTLRKHNSRTPAKSWIEIRVAINTGEVILEEGDVYGEAVNIASRIEGIAEPNEIYFTESTYLSMNKSEVPSAEIGYRLLRGIPERIKIYKVLKEGETKRPRATPVSSTEMSGRPTASAWRRVAAFAIDAAIIGMITGTLMANEFARLSVDQDELNRRAEQMHAMLEGEATGNHHNEVSHLEAELGRREDELNRKIETFERRRDRLTVAEERLQRQQENLEREAQNFSQGGVEAIRPQQVAEFRRFEREFHRREIALGRRWERLEQGREMLGRMEAQLSDEQKSLTRDFERLSRLHEEREGNRDQGLMSRIDDTLWGPEPPPMGAPHDQDISDFRAFASEVSARDGELKIQSIALWMVMFLLYSVILLGWKGRTLGKTLFKLKVYGMNGERVGFLRSLGRCLLYILSAIPLGLGFVWIFVDRNHQGWHDKVAETQVVFEE